MKKYDTKFTQAALFICTKCGKEFDKKDFAEDIKSELRDALKKRDLHKKVRVMVSGCLGLCIKGQQAFLYSPIGAEKSELYATDPKKVHDDILDLIQTKVQQSF